MPAGREWGFGAVRSCLIAEIPYKSTIIMADENPLQHVIDVNRHGGTETLSEPIPSPKVGGNFVLDDAVVAGMLFFFPWKC